jgi:tRNA pseudouridine38-40 synthase
MPVRNIKAVISYDGTDFCGYQLQNKDRTVQGEIEKALQRLHGKEIRITGSGRTDSGVHAAGQVINFFTELDAVATESFPRVINSYLPRDIRMIDAAEAPEDFNARYDAVRREYRYYIYNSTYCPPFYRNYCLQVKDELDISLLNRMALKIIGVNDFTTFSHPGDKSRTRIRELYSSSFFFDKQFLVYRIAGNAFLWKMVRSLVGTMLELAVKGFDESEFEKRLKAEDRKAAGATAPAQGLFLHRVDYD